MKIIYIETGFELVDSTGRTYEFDFDLCGAGKVVINMYGGGPYNMYGAVRVLNGNQIVWEYPYDQYVSSEAKSYAERLVKMKAFL